MPRKSARPRNALIKIVWTTRKQGKNQTVALSVGNVALVIFLIYAAEFVKIAKAAKVVMKMLVGN
jgi:preprotein translocase subunit SecE